ncbi:MAG: hypothetical protein NTX51_18785 [Verrucomicrobia bacterium]|nr:hypothetical protein [Verrucomicrobiota bacterium]
MTKQKRNAALGFVGLLALSVYILACTSFSPDDTKVLYPSFDPASGAIGMAVYDRESGGSEMLFVPVAYESKGTNPVVAVSILRAQWLANGRDVVIAGAAPDAEDKDALTVAVVPWNVRKPIKTFRVPDVKDMAQSLVSPLCVAGERLFFRTSGKALGRLDLRTGALVGHEFADAKGDLSFYPAPDGAGVFYFETDKSGGEPILFGTLNPEDFSRAPLMVVTNRMDDMTTVAYDMGGKTLAMLTGGDNKAALQVWREGKLVFSRAVGSQGKDITFGNAILAANGKAIRATYRRATGTNTVSYGLMEIPFSEAPPRENTLIKDAAAGDKADVFYFQAGISHDGKTAAISSAYLAFSDEGFKPADCALFFVDLGSADWKVTKVPIPMPAKRLGKLN